LLFKVRRDIGSVFGLGSLGSIDLVYLKLELPLMALSELLEVLVVLDYGG